MTSLQAVILTASDNRPEDLEDILIQDKCLLTEVFPLEGLGRVRMKIFGTLY